MRIERATWENLQALHDLGIPLGMIELPDGTTASAEFVYCVFEEGMELFSDGEELQYIVVSDDLWVVEQGTNRRVTKIKE